MNNQQTSLLARPNLSRVRPPYNYPLTPISFFFFFFFFLFLFDKKIKTIVQESSNLVAVLGHVHSVPDDFSTG